MSFKEYFQRTIPHTYFLKDYLEERKKNFRGGYLKVIFSKDYRATNVKFWQNILKDHGGHKLGFFTEYFRRTF